MLCNRVLVLIIRSMVAVIHNSSQIVRAYSIPTRCSMVLNCASLRAVSNLNMSRIDGTQIFKFNNRVDMRMLP